MFKKFDTSLFSKNLARSGMKTQVQAAAVIGEAANVLPEVIGEVAAGMTQPLHVKHGVLTIAVEHPAVGEKIMESSKPIMDALNKTIGETVVHRIQLSLPVTTNMLQPE